MNAEQFTEAEILPAAMYDMPREIARKLADHEVFLSFNCDDQAIAFSAWWNTQGHDLFQKYLQAEAGH